MLFIPGVYQFPILQVGWTLNFEMLFYVLFALTLLLTSKPVLWLSSALASLVLVGVLVGRNWGVFSILASPMLLEFVFGMIVGLASVRGKFLPKGAAVVIGLVSVTALFLSNFNDSAASYRVWFWGVPGCALLASVVSLEEDLRLRQIGMFVKLGDASFSLYLIHALVIGGIWAAAAKIVSMNLLVTAAIYVLAILACVCIAWGVHRMIELPITSYGSKRLAARR
ncbi:hypothetical protein XI09_10135 [Bradyrhizobium sp. CCBAU 11386]|nr:hypothetical protein [Bradyrhizobium sp. CCBAU 11386]